MDHEQLIENAREIFEGAWDTKPYTLKDYQRDLYEGTDGEVVVTQEDIRDACEALVAEGVLQRKGNDAYALTEERLEEMELEDEERILALFTEHLRKQDGKK